MHTRWRFLPLLVLLSLLAAACGGDDDGESAQGELLPFELVQASDFVFEADATNPSRGIFRVTTNINLLELSDLNHPLLKRLQMEAPGTYHHTLMVATLAEQAAESIGANPLLARVAAYFHDVGKLSNPSYFTENAFGQDRHADLSPRMSALIILNHVKEGLVLAQKYKLRKPLREVIASHHGTSRIYFFYRRAVEEAGGDESAVDEFDYRYPGPLPRSREAAIISLADSCEAASRSLQKPLPQKIDALVDDIEPDVL